LKKRIDDDLNRYFYKWFNVDKDKKFKYYKYKMRSTDYYDDRVFEEKAKKDYLLIISGLKKKRVQFLIFLVYQMKVFSIDLK
jgi:hypothetical protein